MYAELPDRAKVLKNGLPMRYMCQSCDEIFNVWTSHPACPICLSEENGNLIVLYLEDDLERAEWLEQIDFTAG